MGASDKAWANLWVDKINIPTGQAADDISISEYDGGSTRNQGITLENTAGFAWLILKGGDTSDSGKISFRTSNDVEQGNISMFANDMIIQADDDISFQFAARSVILDAGQSALRPGTDSIEHLGNASRFWDETFTDELILSNVGAAAAAANTIRLAAVDLSAGNTMLDIDTEGTDVVGTGTPAADRTIAIGVNGTTYYILASTAAS